MKLWHILTLPLALALPHVRNDESSSCRFAPSYTLSDVQADPDAFARHVARAEGAFHADRIGYNQANGMTYDGTSLNYTTGLVNATGLHPFSAASKESLQLMMYAKVLSGDPLAAVWLRPDGDIEQAKDEVVGILKTKLQVLGRFNQTFPGFGGLLPWFYSNETDLRPTWDWVDRIPALDNGEMLWAAYAVVAAMEDCARDDWKEVQQGWQEWLDYTKTTAAKLFYHGEGRVCAVVRLNQSLHVDDPAQNITCEGSPPGLLDDPYEGELFTWWLYFFAPQLSDQDRESLWTVKRAKLQLTEYTGSVVDTTDSSSALLVNYTGRSVVNPLPGGKSITVQKGFWFSAHEQWKLLEMPYLDNNLVYRLFHNAERARTCDAALSSNPGMFASVNNVTNLTTLDLEGYISPAGIPSISFNQAQELDMITPYATFPTMLFDRANGLAWYKNMLDGPKMQNPYGSTESVRRDGTAVSALVTWDSKITTLVAILGGVGDLVGAKMRRDGVYDSFMTVLQREYAMVFGENGENIKGEDVDLCWPKAAVPLDIPDFTSCTA